MDTTLHGLGGLRQATGYRPVRRWKPKKRSASVRCHNKLLCSIFSPWQEEHVGIILQFRRKSVFGLDLDSRIQKPQRVGWTVTGPSPA